MRVLVTGASGFIGRNLLRALDPAWDVVAQYRSREDFPAFASALDRPGLTVLRADLADAPSLAQAPLQVPFDVVFHLAARVDIPRSLTDPAADLRDNATATANVARLVRAGHFVHLSTGAVYEGQSGTANPALPLVPTLPYAAHKLMGELYARAAHERWGTAGRVSIVRFFGAYGRFEPAFKLYARLVRAFAVERAETFAIYGDGSNLVDAMWVEDACAGLLAIAADAGADRPPVWTVDFAGGRPLSIDAVVAVASETLLGRRVVPSHRGTAPERNAFFGDPEPLARRLGVRAATPLAEGFRRYAALARGA